MNTKERLLKELKNPDFPDLQFLYSQEVLAIAPEVLEELLEQEIHDFREKLTISDAEITFETFQEFSLLDYFFGLLEHYKGVHSNEQMREIIEAFEPKYIDFGNEVSYSKRYYDMLCHCLAHSDLTQQQKRILQKSIETYEVRGIALNSQKQNQLKTLNKELSELSQKFANNVLDSQNTFSYIIKDESIISEMPEDDKQVAQQQAEGKEKTGYLFDASPNSYMSIMKYCSDRNVRKDFFVARNKFATEEAFDNRPLILSILEKRDQKSQLLGYKNYAELSLHFKMADTPEQILEIFEDISSKAQQKARKENEELEQYFSLDELRAYDLSYYARKLKQEKYALDEKELKKYFVFENVQKGMFEIVQKLTGLDIQKIHVDTYDENVSVYEVSKEGKFLSYFFTDYFYRPLKRNGAWANILKEKFAGNKKIVVNVANFQKSTDEQTLLTLGDVETMFHEFGHAIHEMLSVSPHSELSGFHVEWDFVELPSQLLENWCRHPDGLNMYAQHKDTGKGIPASMIDSLQKLETFGNGNMVIKQNEYACLDMGLHSTRFPQDICVLDSWVCENYQKNALFPISEVYSPHTTFTHIFDGGYAAGYYSYMWAEILEKEVWKAFVSTGNIFDTQTAQNFCDTILSQGTIKKASELFRDFMGRDVQIEAFLHEKGLS